MSETEDQSGYCSYCGTKNTLTSDFCSKCGKQLSWSKEPSTLETSSAVEVIPSSAKKKPSYAKIGCLTLVGGFVFLFVLGLIVGNPPTKTTPNSPNDVMGSYSFPATDSDIPGIGDRPAGVVDNVTYAVAEIQKQESIGDSYSNTRADGMFAIVSIYANNQDNHTHEIMTGKIKVMDSKGREYSPSSNGETALVAEGDKKIEPMYVELQPGTPKIFKIVYDVASNAGGLRIKIPDEVSGKDLLLYEPS